MIGRDVKFEENSFSWTKDARDSAERRLVEEDVQSDEKFVPVEPFDHENELLADDVTDKREIVEPVIPALSSKSDLDLSSGRESRQSERRSERER